MGVEHHRGAAPGVEALDRRAELLLDDVLHGGVEGEVEVGTRPRLDGGQARRQQRPPMGVAQHGAPAGAAGDDAVVVRLEAGEADVVGADEAEHLRRQLAHRVVALALAQEVDAGQVQRPHGVGQRLVELARHKDEVALRAQPALEIDGVSGAAWRAASPGLGARSPAGGGHESTSTDTASTRRASVDGAARRLEVEHPQCCCAAFLAKCS